MAAVVSSTQILPCRRRCDDRSFSAASAVTGRRSSALATGHSAPAAAHIGGKSGRRNQARRVMATKPGKIEKTDAEWRAELSPEAYHVARKHGTERAFTIAPQRREARRACSPACCCGEPVFASADKFESGTGWPSFYPADRRGRCRRAGRPFVLHAPHRSPLRALRGHLGHVFPDGPAADRSALLHQRRGAELRAGRRKTG